MELERLDKWSTRDETHWKKTVNRIGFSLALMWNTAGEWPRSKGGKNSKKMDKKIKEIVCKMPLFGERLSSSRFAVHRGPHTDAFVPPPLGRVVVS